MLNPKAVNRFAQSIRRSRTDKADAQALAEYSQRMPFRAWRAPNAVGLQLRPLIRHIAGLTVQYTREHKLASCCEGYRFYTTVHSCRLEALCGFSQTPLDTPSS